MKALLLAALGAAPVDALRAPTVKLSVRESVLLALEKSPSVRAAVERKRSANGQYLEARGFALPQFSAELSYTRLPGPTGFYEAASEIPGAEGLIPDKDIYAGWLSLTQVVYQGGLVRAGMAAAEINRHMAAETIENEKRAVAFRVRLAYYDVLLARALLRVAEEAVELARSHRRDVQLKRSKGAASEFELLRTTVHVQNLLSSRLQAEKRLGLARERLLSEVDLPRRARLVLTDALPEVAGSGEFETELGRALVSRSELRLADLEIQLYELNVVRARARYRPQVDFVFRWGDEMYKGPLHEEWDPSWSATVAVRVPIFDGLQARGKVIQAEAAVRALREKRRGLRRMVELELSAALSSLEMARQFLDAQSHNVGQAREALRLARARFREGMATQLEVQDARLALSQAETNLAQARYELARAGLDIEKATGNLQLPGEAK